MSARLGQRGSFYELNYLVSENQAVRVRDFVREYLEMDESGVGRPNYAYPVHALCLDSDDLNLYWRALNDIEHRHQLRVRYLSSSPDEAVHLEIKRRLADAVIKERCPVRPEVVPLVLAGGLVGPQQLAERNPLHLEVLQRFVAWAQSIRARPKLHIGFLREGYTSWDHAVRVTMDRQIQCEPHFTAKLKMGFANPCPLFPSQVLLELSYAERFPYWFREMVEHFNLLQCEADKFVAAISTLGIEALGGPP